MTMDGKAVERLAYALHQVAIGDEDGVSAVAAAAVTGGLESALGGVFARASHEESSGKAILIGSSTVAGMGTRLQAALGTRGVEATFNRTAVGSWQASHISAAAGTRPLVCEAFTIPASGPVTITPTNQTEANNVSAAIVIPGYFAGVIGMVSSPAGSGAWTFTRDAAGDPVPVPAGTPFLPSVPEGRRRGLAVVNFGKNTLTTTALGWDAARCVQMTESVDRHFGAADGRVLIVGHFVNTTTPAQSTTRTRTKAYNDYCRDRFGDRFFDLGAYLTGSQVWADTGLTPTADDTTEQGLGNKPPSLSSDNGHLNAAGYDAVVKAIMQRLEQLAWIAPPPPSSWTVKATDNFNRSNGALTGQGTTTGGLTWALPSGATSSLNISGNAVATPSGTSKNVVDPGSANQRVGVRLAALGTGPANRAVRVLVRVADTSTYYFASPRVDNANDGVSIWKNKSGAVTSLKSTGATVPANGDYLEIEVDGSTLIAYLNGAEVIRTADTDLATGKAGIEIQSVTCSVDDFSVSIRS